MENLSKSHIWLAAAALLATCGVCASAGVGNRKPFTPTDSILDIIDTEQVQRFLAERQRAEQATASASTSFVQRNELGDGSSETGMVVSMPEQEENTELPPGVEFRKILKSSKNALVVTKKDYLKEDWCKTEPLVQKIREPGCLPTTVINKFCYGQCNSFYIPKGPRRRDNNPDRPQPAFKSCSFCRPKKFTWVTVTLRCPGQNPPFKRKRLQKVKQCKCLPVGVNWRWECDGACSTRRGATAEACERQAGPGHHQGMPDLHPESADDQGCSTSLPLIVCDHVPVYRLCMNWSNKLRRRALIRQCEWRNVMHRLDAYLELHCNRAASTASRRAKALIVRSETN